jgi:hypothetical protein
MTESSDTPSAAPPPAAFPPRGPHEIGEAGRLFAECGVVMAAARSSLHPRRWLVALLLLLLLGELGRVHDRASEPRVGPSGLLAVDPAADLAAAMELAGKLLRTGGGGTMEPMAAGGEDASPRELRRRLEEAVSGRIEAWRGETSEAGREAILLEIRQLEAVMPQGTAAAAGKAIQQAVSGICSAVVSLDPRGLAAGLHAALFAVPEAVWRVDRPFLLWWGVPAAVLVSFFGVVIARIAACGFARRQWLSISDSTDFAVASAGRAGLMPLIPILAALVLLLVSSLWSLGMRVPVLDLLAGIAFGVVIGLALLAAIVLIVSAAASPMLVASVACEDTDAGDCLQRAIAFAAHRPARYLALLAAALAGGVAGVVFVDGVVVAALRLASAAAESAGPAWSVAAIGSPVWLAFGEGRAVEAAWLDAPFAADAVATWAALLRMAVGAYAFAVFFDAGVRIYLLQRFACDGRRPEEIAESPGRVPRADRVREAIAAASRRDS